MAKTKIKVKTKWGKKETKSNIKVKAKTLGAALKELQKLDEWGKFEGEITYKHKPKSGGPVTDVILEPSYLIRMPTWDGAKSAPKACKKEWDRMWKKLEEHEDKHRLIHLEMLAKFQQYLAEQTDLTVKQLTTDLKKMKDEAQKDQDKFDKSSDHGANEGVNLNITEECE